MWICLELAYQPMVSQSPMFRSQENHMLIMQESLPLSFWRTIELIPTPEKFPELYFIWTGEALKEALKIQQLHKKNKTLDGMWKWALTIDPITCWIRAQYLICVFTPKVWRRQVIKGFCGQMDKMYVSSKQEVFRKPELAPQCQQQPPKQRTSLLK